MLSRRLGYAVVGGGMLVAMMVVGRLEPSSTGYGTHQQLGLPACAFQSLTGWRCPSCGVTTACCWLARGEVVQAATTHATGTVLAAGMMAGGAMLLWASMVGWQWNWLRGERAAAIAALFGTAALCEWLVRLLIERFG
jgi:hypothetical protein